MTDVSIALSTVIEVEHARKIAGILVKEKLAACVSLLPSAESHYVWKDELHQDTEIVLLIKFPTAKNDILKKRLLEIHPYECPEFITWDIKDGHRGYLEWVLSNCKVKD